MKLNKVLIPVGALALALGAGQFSAEAAQRRNGRDQNGQDQQGQTEGRPGGLRQGVRERAGESRQNRPAPPPETRVTPRQEHQAAPPQDNRAAQRQDNRVAAPRDNRGGDQRGNNRDFQRGGQDNRGGSFNDNRGGSFNDNRGGSFNNAPRSYSAPRGYDAPRGYNAPRYSQGRQVYPRRYGSGGNLSLYFQLGSGYRYGSPYSGRVYGYSAPYSSVYGSRRYFGDVRLQIRPRNAAVFVDGYYAGVVDDFDGIFQRLTLEVGRHQIEVEAPGFEPQAFDVYVDPARTVDLRGDLFPDRRF